MTRLPKIRPDRFVKNASKQVVVLAGDSVTHGQVGENYVRELSQRLDNDAYDIVNAGINSHLAWNLLQRIEEIIDCEPDYVTIMIGTNDANAATSKKEAESYIKRMNLPQMPDQNWYRQSLIEIVNNLQQRTSAKIALISIPTLGEDQDHFAYGLSTEYAKISEDVATSTGVDYIPLHEKMSEMLEETPGCPAYPIEKARVGMITACFKRYILRKDWDSIGESSGFQLHIDYLHLNNRGAALVSDLVEQFVTQV
ncbi:MAG: SGNH/GDSL hydrolase family protein [Candidatus Thorarchaeota archaeon]